MVPFNQLLTFLLFLLATLPTLCWCWLLIIFFLWSVRHGRPHSRFLCFYKTQISQNTISFSRSCLPGDGGTDLWCGCAYSHIPYDQHHHVTPLPLFFRPHLPYDSLDPTLSLLCFTRYLLQILWTFSFLAQFSSLGQTLATNQFFSTFPSNLVFSETHELVT